MKRKENSLSRNEIIRGYSVVQDLLTYGNKIYGKFVILYYIADSPERKAGFIVSKKYKKAVNRNRMRRLMREVFRKHKKYFPQGRLLFFAKHSVPLPRYDDILNDMLNLTHTHGKNHVE